LALISLTRLRLVSPRFLPAFAWHTVRAILQARRAPGFLGLRLLVDRRLTFWTMTAWEDLAAMKRFRSSGAHRKAMPRLVGWCDEAAVTRWDGDPGTMGDWTAAHAHLVETGESSAIRHPSVHHLARFYPPPRLTPPIELRLAERG
jgi:Antibiotic biosynthesis monooxygenase